MSSPTDAPWMDANATESLRFLLPQSVGWQLALFLGGIYAMLHGGFVLSSHYKRVSWRVQGVLWSVFVLEAVFTVMIAVEQDMWTITTDNSYSHLFDGTWVVALARALNAAIAVVTQSVLTIRAAYMIQSVTRQRVFLGVITVLILIEVAAATLSVIGVDNYVYGSDGHIGPLDLETNDATAFWLWTSAVIDLAISLTLSLSLKQRIAGFNAKTDTVLRKLIIGALQTASYTTFLAILAASTSVAYGDLHPFSRVPFAFIYPLPPCYAISLYTTLATRRTVDTYIGMPLPPPGGSGETPNKLGGNGLPESRIEERPSKADEAEGRRAPTPGLSVSMEGVKGRSREWTPGGLLKGDLEDDSPV
ncbi:hypothetical protein JCM11251_001997 [Rhodosporidiobolus azoricus]